MAKGKTNVIWTVFFASLVLFGSVIGSRNACPAPSPCLCDGVVIECEAHNLPNITTFSYVQTNYSILRFGVNTVTTVPASAFIILNVKEIHLDYNRISSVDPGAFHGMETQLQVLNLAHNRLKTMPLAIGTLTSISDLDISYNPIKGYIADKHGQHHTDGFVDSVMKAVGDSLNKFKFGDDILYHWPKSLHHLVQLQELRFTGSAIRRLNHGAFHGFEYPLKKLFISHTTFVQIPLDISVFTQLEELHFDHNSAQDGDSVIIPQPLTAINKTLKVLSLSYDNLTVVPSALKDLGMLNNISLDGNPFQFISQEAISFIKRTRVRILSFRHCSLTRIPGSLSDLSNLIELDVSGNLLKTIESVDLRHMPTLQTLTLARNPLKFISSDSFIGLNSVSVLDMSYSEISVIPESIVNLDSLKVLNFLHSKIDCTCDLFWVRRLMTYIHVTIKGQCETIDQSIQDYVMHRVPQCRDYQINMVG